MGVSKLDRKRLTACGEDRQRWKGTSRHPRATDVSLQKTWPVGLTASDLPFGARRESLQVGDLQGTIRGPSHPGLDERPAELVGIEE